MDTVTPYVKYPLRDPMGDVSRYEEIFEITYASLNGEDQEVFSCAFLEWEEVRRIKFESVVMGAVQARLLHMHSRGDPVDDLIRRLQDDLPFLQARTHSRRERWAQYSGQPLNPEIGYVNIYDRNKGFSYCAIAMLLLPTADELGALLSVVQTGADYRLYVFDLLAKSFFPAWRLPKKKYPVTAPVKDAFPWAEPIVRALAQPPDQRSSALAQYMKNWGITMKPWGWKPHRDFSQEAVAARGELESLFVHSSLEVALAVCAYDIDDTLFYSHPYYPRDLVEHYRTHVRNTRDAWRPVGVGAGIEVQAPPLPPKLDLAKSKSKGLQRWLELVSDGDADATAAVLEQVGKVRKVKDSFALSCALGENNAGLCADIKDDETLAAQIDRLLDKRGLVGWDTQGLPPAGPARCSALLLALDAYLSDKPYVLRAMGGEDDSWQGVVVPRLFEAEFAELSASLAIGTANPRQAYDI